MGNGFIILILIWFVSFIYNTYYFFNKKGDDVDTIFLNKSKSFKEALEDIKTLENYLKSDFSSARKKIEFYAENARLTKRKYYYYSDKIEPYFLKEYLGLKRSKRYCWSVLDLPVKLHFGFLIAIFFSLLFLLIVLTAFSIFVTKEYNILIPVLSTLILLIVFFKQGIKLNYVIFFILLDGILILFKKDRCKLYKNLALIEFMTAKLWNSSNSWVAISAGGAAGFSSGGGGGGFGGFGGGSFGGGGAGGSW